MLLNFDLKKEEHPVSNKTMRKFIKMCLAFILFIIRALFYPVKILNKIIYGPSNPNIVGYAWYSKDGYRTLIESSDDNLDEIVPTYALWKEKADSFIDTYEKKGWIIIKVKVEIKELEIWLSNDGLLNIGENRQKYVNYRMRQFLKNAVI